MDSQSPKESILIVDDMPVNVEIVEKILKHRYDVTITTDGPSALEMAKSQHPPDLILLDVIMPDMDGYEVCKRLKADKMSRDIPVIFLTAKNEEADEAIGFKLGAVDYITKPFNPAILKARVQTHLALKAMNDRLKDVNKRLGAAYSQMREWRDSLAMQLQGEEAGFLLGESGKILGVTEKGVESTARKRRDLIGGNILDLVNEESRRELFLSMRKASIGGFCQMILPIRGGNGTQQVFEAKFMNLNIKKGRMLLVLMRALQEELVSAAKEVSALAS